MIFDKALDNIFIGDLEEPVLVDELNSINDIKESKFNLDVILEEQHENCKSYFS